jgi:hypothetical protein
MAMKVGYRRTGFPALRTISASLNNNLIQYRYLTLQKRNNRENYNSAAAATDNNGINFPVWDKIKYKWM